MSNWIAWCCRCDIERPAQKRQDALVDPGSDDEVDLRGCAQDIMCCPSTAGHRVTTSAVPNLYRFAEADARESRA
jgi:hypothetical protein